MAVDLFTQARDRDDQYQVCVSYIASHLDRVVDIGLYAKQAIESGDKPDFDHMSLDSIEKKFLQVREKSGAQRGQTFIKGMTQTELMSPSELAEYIDNGRDIESQLLEKLGTSKDRVTSIVILHVRNITMGNVARVHLVALANVERIKHTDNTTPKLKESIVLNNSISTLTKVLSHIWQMQTGQDVEQDRIPSTLDSKLTRILQSVLVPQTLVSMFVTIYPLEKNYEDVLSAVRLPNRIKGVHYEGHPAKVVFSPTSSI